MTIQLAPRAGERPRDAGWVEAGTLNGVGGGRVDWAGLVSPPGAGWSLDWWIGADDRWYLPAREPTIRQRRLGPGPVIETLMRIPGGDARHLAYGVLVGGREMTVVEVHNDSPVPVALALALRPYPVGSSGPVHGAGAGGSAADPFPGGLRLDGPAVRAAGDVVGGVVGGVVGVKGAGGVLVAGAKPPSHAGASAHRDLVAAVEAGEELRWDDGAGGPEANAVLLYPLPHRTSLRFVVPSGPGGVADPDPRGAPDAEAVARGWRSVLDVGARVVLPDPGLAALFDGARARLLLATPDLGSRLARLDPGTGSELKALAVAGHWREVARAVGVLAESYPTRLAASGAETAADAAAALEGVALAAGRGWLAQPPAGADHLDRVAEVAAQITTLIDRAGDNLASARGRLALAGLAATVDPAGAARLAASVPEELRARAHPAVGLVEVNELAGLASPAGVWGGPSGDDPRPAARFVGLVRRLLVDDAGPGLVLLPGFPSSWRGGNLEVHDLPTAHGSLSFAVRWHGYRPALLWQLDPDAGLGGGDHGPALTAPALDAGWTTTASRGEALLTGSPDQLPDRPAPGDSFT